jgi:hypothetical protein
VNHKRFNDGNCWRTVAYINMLARILHVDPFDTGVYELENITSADAQVLTSYVSEINT